VKTSSKPECGAKKRQGEGVCTLMAGWGTDHPGYGLCKLHGGRMQAHRRRATGMRVADELAALDVLVRENPFDALMGELWRSGTWQAYLERRVGDLEEIYGPDHRSDDEAHVLLRLWNDERDRHARLAKMAIDAGVAEGYLRLAEAEAERVVRAVFATLDDPELFEALGVGDRDRAQRVAGRHLRAIAVGSVDAPTDEVRAMADKALDVSEATGAA
jgi:hypothetical protein